MTTFGIHTELGNHDLARWAVRDALSMQEPAPSGLDVAFFGTATHGFLEGQTMVSGEIALRELGVESIPIHNVENACATGAWALSLAVTHVRAARPTSPWRRRGEDARGGSNRALALFDTAYDVRTRALTRAPRGFGGEVRRCVRAQVDLHGHLRGASAQPHVVTRHAPRSWPLWREESRPCGGQRSCPLPQGDDGEGDPAAASSRTR